jgi:steroid 5-alpha reductase family enzyme
MTFTGLLGTAALWVLAFTTVGWLVSLAVKKASIVDSLWSLCFLVIAIVGYLYGNPAALERRQLLLVLVAIWGIRLSLHITVRNWGEPEDYRYQEFRQKYGPERYWWFSLFQVFWLQGLLALLVSAPLLAAASASEFSSFDPLWLGVVLWVIGFVFEAGGDWQLARFKADPANAGKVMDRGFWRYTRHPNYFGDFAVWWGYGLIALASPLGWVALLGPLLMSVLLLKVSGVAMLEKTITSRRPGYAEYVARTSAFFPRPPKKA